MARKIVPDFVWSKEFAKDMLKVAEDYRLRRNNEIMEKGQCITCQCAVRQTGSEEEYIQEARKEVKRYHEAS